MLVDHDRRVPRQTLADGNHRRSSVYGFVFVERQRRARGEEGCKVDIGIVALGDIADNGGECARVEAMAINTPAHVGERLDRRRMGDRDSVSLDDAKPLPGRLPELRLSWREQAIHSDPQGHPPPPRTPPPP